MVTIAGKGGQPKSYHLTFEVMNAEFLFGVKHLEMAKNHLLGGIGWCSCWGEVVIVSI